MTYIEQPITFFQIVDFDDTYSPVPVMLRYNSDDPLVIVVEFPTNDLDNPNTWIFSRDMVAIASISCDIVGPGLVTMWTIDPYMYFILEGDYQNETCTAAYWCLVAEIHDFIRSTIRLVPGVEEERKIVWKELDQLAKSLGK